MNVHTVRWLAPLLLLCSQVALVAACYAGAATLPLFWDDVAQLTWLRTVDLADLWRQTVPGLNYFRPLAFTVWDAVAPNPTQLDAVALHAVNIALHAANAWLVGMLVARMVAVRRWWTALAAASLFALFPFGFQAVLPVSSLMHPLHAAAILAAALAFLAYLDAGRAGWLALSAALVGAAIFSHENGAIAPALVLLTAVCRPGLRAPRRLGVGALAVSGAALLCLLAWAAVPRGTAPLALAGILEHPTERIQNAALFLQALAFPVSMLALPLQAALSIEHDLLAIAVVSLPAVLLWWALAGWRLQPGWALAWHALAALPALALLDFSYVLESPRLTYLAAAGAAAFWAMPLGFDAHAPRARLAFVAGVTVIACAWGFTYVQRRIALYQAMGDAIAQVGAAATDRACASAPQGAGAIAVNFPAWYFVREPEYVLGHDGITSLSEGGRLADLIALNNAWRGELGAVALPDVLNAGSAFVPLGEPRTHDALAPELRASGAVIVNDPASRLGGFALAGCRLAEGAGLPARADFAGGPELLAGALDVDATDRRAARVVLDWRARAAADDLTVFVHVVDAAGAAAGALVAQADGYPLRGTSPLRTWQSGDAWRDVRTVRLPADVRPGDYAVLVGVYRTADGARLAAADAAGQPLPDDAVRIATWRVE